MGKSDINLLPRKKKIPLSVMLGIVFGSIGFLALVAAGIVLPNLALKSKQAQLDALKADIAVYADVQEQYDQKLAEFTLLQQQQANYLSFAETDRQTLELMKQILAVTPESITLTDQTYTLEHIVLLGHATSNLEIGRYEVALRGLGIFGEIALGTINEVDGQWTFDFVLTHMTETDTTESSEGGASK